MTLPRRIPKASKRESRWRSRAHCNFVRGFQCSVPGCASDAPTEVAHVRIGSGAGMGQRPDDWNTVSLCRTCHREQHAIGETTFWSNRLINITALVDEFIAASPKRREIETIRSTRAAGASLRSGPPKGEA